MRYYIIAGETSGDIHGGHLISAIRDQDPDANFRVWGGNKMSQASGVSPQRTIEELSYMGFAEVVVHLPKILANIKFCKQDILAWQPDVLILIDFPGFNLRIANWAKKNDIKVFYYIAPQTWAWKENRVKKMRACIDALFVILPFEKKYFEEKGLQNVYYFGHPLLDEVVKHDRPDYTAGKVALLPGSRKQEIERMLPIFINVCKMFPKKHFYIAKAPNVDHEMYEKHIKDTSNINIHSGGVMSLLPDCQAAIVTSGTATLETALYKVPQLVAYKGSWISYWIAKSVVNIKYISLVNLILDHPLLEEYIQGDCTPEKLSVGLQSILKGEHRSQIISGYEELADLLGDTPIAQKIAQAMVKLL